MDKLEQLRTAIHELTPKEVKLLLMHAMLQMDSTESNKNAKVDLYDNLKELYEELLVSKMRRQIWEPDSDSMKVHMLFGDSAAGSLKVAIKKMELIDTNKVISFHDNYSIGPLWQLHEEAGRLRRMEWFRDHINVGYDEYEDESEAYHQSLLEQIAKIPKQASIVLWISSNAHEQVGLRHAVYMLRDIPNDIFVFHVDEACSKRFNRSDAFIDYVHSGEIPDEKLQAVFGASEDDGPITIEDRKSLEREWLALAEQQEVLRIWSQKRILSVDHHYFDSYLLKTVEKLHAYKENNEFIKAARVIGEAIGHCDQYIGDSYFEYRLRELIYSSKLEIKGVPRAMRYYSVRRK